MLRAEVSRAACVAEKEAHTGAVGAAKAPDRCVWQEAVAGGGLGDQLLEAVNRKIAPGQRRGGSPTGALPGRWRQVAAQVCQSLLRKATVGGNFAAEHGQQRRRARGSVQRQ